MITSTFMKDLLEFWSHITCCRFLLFVLREILYRNSLGLAMVFGKKWKSYRKIAVKVLTMPDTANACICTVYKYVKKSASAANGSSEFSRSLHTIGGKSAENANGEGVRHRGTMRKRRPARSRKKPRQRRCRGFQLLENYCRMRAADSSAYCLLYRSW